MTTGSRPKAPCSPAQWFPPPYGKVTFPKGNQGTGTGRLGLTDEAYALLIRLIARGYMTTRQLVDHGATEERWRKRQALGELLERGYAYRDSVGWYRPASHVEK